MVRFIFKKPLFIIEGAAVGGGGGEGGWRLNFYLFSFDLWEGEGRGLIFFLKIIFSLLNG